MDETLSQEWKDAEVRDTLEELVPMLKWSGLMEPYRQVDGRIGI